MKKQILFSLVIVTFIASLSYAGGWDKEKGIDQITLKGELLCVGCTLKKMNGQNAQCNLFAQHSLGFKSQEP